MKKLLIFIVLAVVTSFSSFAWDTDRSLTDEEIKELMVTVDSELPIEMGDGVVWEKVFCDNGNIILNFKFDEHDMTATVLEPFADELKASLIEAFIGDPDSFQFLELVADNGKNLKINFKGAQTNKNIALDFPNSELKSYVRR